MQNDWTLSKEFKFVGRRSKEIDHVVERLEEAAFRTAGQFNGQEVEAIKDIFNVGRGNSYYDRMFKASDD